MRIGDQHYVLHAFLSRKPLGIDRANHSSVVAQASKDIDIKDYLSQKQGGT
jgi:hypothetical protein